METYRAPFDAVQSSHGRRARGGNKPSIRGWRCSDHDPPPPPPPLAASVVRHPVPQTLHNFGRTRKLSPICCTTLLGSKKQEIRHPAPGFLISWVLGGSKTQEIRNPAYFQGCGREQNPGNRKSSPWISYFLGFGREQNTGNKKSNPWRIYYFLCFSKSISNLNPPPIAFGRSPKLSPICCRNPKPVKATGYQIFTFAACLRANSETLAWDFR